MDWSFLPYNALSTLINSPSSHLNVAVLRSQAVVCLTPRFNKVFAAKYGRVKDEIGKNLSYRASMRQE